jgi:hypothetical protein
VIVKEAELLPARTVTDAGTWALPSLEDNVTTVSVGTFPEKLTVPVVD